MMPSTLKRGRLDAAYDDAYGLGDRLPVPHHGLLDLAGPIVSPADPAAALVEGLPPLLAVDEHIEIKPLAPPVDRALARLMGDIGQLDNLAARLVERLNRVVRPAEVDRLVAKRAEDRVRHGDSDYVVALDNAGERVVDVSNKLAALIAAIEV